MGSQFPRIHFVVRWLQVRKSMVERLDGANLLVGKKQNRGTVPESKEPDSTMAMPPWPTRKYALPIFQMDPKANQIDSHPKCH